MPLPGLVLLRLFFFVVLGGLGAVVPFMGARLESLGLSGAELGSVLAMLPVGRLLGAPLWGWLADRYRMSGLLLRVGCALSGLGALLLALAHSLPAALFAVLLFAVGFMPLTPLMDATILRALAAAGQPARDYGRVRLWGSVGFMCSALAAAAAARADLYQPVEQGAALLGLGFLLTLRLPRRGEGGPAPILPALRVLARSPFLAPLLLTASLQALTLSVYDTFFSVHVKALGLPELVTAAAVAVGVGAEVSLMRASPRILSRIGPQHLLLVAALAGLPRWAATAWVSDPTVLVALQVLHGVTFGAYWVSAVQIMGGRAPAAVAASAQSLLAACSYGLGALAGALLAGQILERWGSRAIFGALTLVSALAVVSALALIRRLRAQGVSAPGSPAA